MSDSGSIRRSLTPASEVAVAHAMARSDDADERHLLFPAARRRAWNCRETPGVELPRDALLVTKLHRPPARSGLVQRPRLTGRLSAGLRGPLTVIVAPAGSGKTTLLGDWHAAHVAQVTQSTQATAQPVAWLALDAGDVDGALTALREGEAMGTDRRGNVAASAGRVAAARARLWLTSPAGDGGMAAATRWADEREETRRTDKSPGYAGVLEGLTLARLRLEQGRRDDAAAVLARLLGIAEVGGLMGCVIEILALQARLLLEQGQEAQAMLALSRALALGLV